MVQLKFAAIAEVNRLHRKRLAKQSAEAVSHAKATTAGGQVPRLRVSIIPGGCMGMVYNLALVDAVHSSDRVFHQTSIDNGQGDIEVVVDAASLPYIQDLVLDYSEDLMGGGFRFHNPKVSQSCGCGNSFAALS